MGKRKIIFRADGGLTLGMGHFIRTLSIAEMLKDDFYCIYATQSPTNYQINEIRKVCHERIDLPRNETHFNIFLNLLIGDEIVVLDNYYFSTEYQQQIKIKGCKLVCIDDLHDKHFFADIIINHAEGISKFQYSSEKYTKYCLGFKYALLRKEYLLNEPVESFKKYACFVMMGGIDPYRLTEKLVTMINPTQSSLPIAVIIGADNINYTTLKLFKNIELFKGIESSSIFQLMQESLVGVLPASTVAVEACAARLPFVCGYYVDNQKAIYTGIKSNKLAICVGNYLDIIPKDIINALEKLRNIDVTEKIILRQKILLDKKSKGRFVKIFRKL